jgi:microcystin-dependent protein
MPYQPFLGQIMPFAGIIIPKNWALCNGQLLAINQNTALFSLLGTMFGGNGVNTFALPDLRGRAIMGSSGTSGDNIIGTTSGTPTVQLLTSQIPAHNHSVNAAVTQSTSRGSTQAKNNVFGTNTEPVSAPKKIFITAGTGETNLAVGTNVVNDGGNAPHNNMQPYLAISYLIALSGIFPSRG